MWKEIRGWEGLYSVSMDGKVKSIRRNREIYTQISNCGYVRVCFWLKNKNTTVSVHRLVAEHFIPNPENKPFVNHIDGNKQNNHISNLEWSTRSENELHASINKLKAFGFRNKKTKLNDSQILQIREKRQSGISVKELSNVYKVGISHIYKIINYESR